MNKFLSILVLFLSYGIGSSAFAEWKTINVVVDVNSTVREEIAENLPRFERLMNQLNGASLASPSKVVVSELVGKVLLLQWEQPQDCTWTPDRKRAYHKQAQTVFHYSDKSDEEWMMIVIDTPIDGCSNLRKETNHYELKRLR